MNTYVSFMKNTLANIKRKNIRYTPFTSIILHDIQNWYFDVHILKGEKKMFIFKTWKWTWEYYYPIKKGMYMINLVLKCMHD